MASRTTTDPIDILLEMGVDLDNLSEEEDYLSALMEAVNTLTIKDAKDPRIAFLQQEIIKVRKKRFNKARPEAKKTTIKPDAFFNKKSEEVRDNVRTGAINSKKLKFSSVNIAPKQQALPTSAIVPFEEPQAEEVKEKKKEEPRNLLAEIAASVTNIADTLKNQYNLKKKEGEFDRKKAQRDKRKLDEKNLEKGFGTLLKSAQKVIKPVQGFFDKIFNFIKQILIGKFLIGLVNWVSKPENQKKLFNIIDFLGKHWKKLLSLYLVFGTGLGRFVFSLTKLLITGAIKLGAAVAKLLAVKGLKRFAGVARFLGGSKGKLIATGAATALTVGGTMMGINSLGFSGGGEVPGNRKRDGEDPQSGGGMIGFPDLGGGGGGTNALTSQVKARTVRSMLTDPTGIKARRAFFNDPQAYLSDEDFKNRGTFPEDRNKRKKGRGAKEYGEGGEVDGPGGTDKVPAMLTAGEFVMSRGAVQRFGIKQLEAMNAAGGGTNQPKIVDNKVYASVGGFIGDPDLGKRGTPDPEEETKSQSPEYSSGSLISNPLGALDRILGQSSGGKFRLPRMGSESPRPDTAPPKSDPKPQPKLQPPKSKPESKPKEPLVPGKADPLPPQEQGIPEKMLKSPTFRDSGLLYLRHLMGGLGGAITEQDLSKETKYELNTAIGRAKERHEANLAKATREWEEAKKGGWDKSDSQEGRNAYATRKSQYERLKSGQIQVLYQDYYDGNDESTMTESAEDAKSVLGQFWAQQTEEGGYKIVNEKYDFQPMNDPLAVLMGDSRGIAKDAEDGKPGQEISLRNKLQAIAQLNPFTKDMSVDMILGQPESAERKTNNILRKMGGVIDFIMRDTTDFDGQGVVASNEAKGEMGVPFPKTTPAKPETPLLPEKTQEKLDAKPKLTPQQIKNNQAYAASKGKYYSSTTGKTYANYAEALKDPEVAAGAKKMEQKKQSTMNMILGGKDAYYSSTTNQYYKNYAEALKDPKVKAAAEVEKVKQQYSFTPSVNQQPKSLAPEPPQNPSVNVIQIPSKKHQGGQRAAPRGGSRTPEFNAGNGSSSKHKILGIF